jgi:hypothetical protein
MGIRTVLLFVLSIAGILFFAGCGQGMDESDGFNVTHEEFYIMLSEKGKEKGIKLSKQNAGNSVLTREKMCQLISEYIENTPYLKNKYIPEKILVERGEESSFFKKLFQGREVVVVRDREDEILLKQMESAKRMSVRTEMMRDGFQRTFHIYCENVDSTRFENILKDYDLINKKYRKACLDACHYGYIDIFFSDSSYEAYFNAREKVTREEALKVIDNLFDKEYLPLDCIRINFWEDDEFDNGINKEHAYLCINDLPCLYVAKKLENLLGDNDKVYMTIGLDNMSFSLWYNSLVFGMLEIPVLFFLDKDVVVEVSRLDTENIKAGLNVCSEVVCGEYKESFLEFAKDVIENNSALKRDNWSLVFML